MPSALNSTEPSSWSAVFDTAQQFRTECADLESLVDHLLVELDRAGAQLISQAESLQSERLRLAQRERELGEQRAAHERLSQRFERQEGQLVEALKEIKRLQTTMAEGGLGDASRSANAGSADHEIELLRVEAVMERNELREQLIQSHDELLQLGSVVKELVEARAEFEERSLHTDHEEEDAKEWEQERSLLESELDLVRRRAAELAETVAEQRLELADQRSTTSSELKQLRQTVERQTALLAQRVQEGARAAESVQAEAAKPKEASDAAHDPVIDSVMAQFAKLQKDVSQRRQRKR